MKKISKKTKMIITGSLLLTLLCCSLILEFTTKENISTNSNNILSNTKIEWGIKREDNHEQPDLGAKNKELITKYNGMAMGNKDEKYIYLTFDLGYEAGYTEKILDALKENNVQGTFFITAHYVNSASDILQRMIDEGHIIGNHFPNSSMYLLNCHKNVI